MAIIAHPAHAAPVSPATAERETSIMLKLAEARDLRCAGLDSKAEAMERAVSTSHRLSPVAVSSYYTAVEEALRSIGALAAAQ